jgi:predicted Zn-dependent protease
VTRRDPRFLFALAALVAAVLSVCAVPLVAAPSRTWPGPIRVYNPTGWQRSVAAAIGAWNRTGARVRFVLVSRVADTDVVIVASDRALAEVCRPRRGCMGYAWPVGHRPSAGTPAYVYLPDAPAQEVKDDAVTATTAAHELGHILGLRHRTGCSIMNPAALEQSCPAKDLHPSAETYLCGPMRADVDDAIALYGGRRARAYRPVCPSGSL